MKMIDKLRFRPQDNWLFSLWTSFWCWLSAVDSGNRQTFFTQHALLLASDNRQSKYNASQDSFRGSWPIVLIC